MQNKVVNKTDCIRIADDAWIAIDCLRALYEVAHEDGMLHTSYIAEKTKVAQNCLDFIKSFVEEEE